MQVAKMEGKFYRRVLICCPERYISRLLEVVFERRGSLVTCVRDEKEALETLESGQSRGDPPFDRAVIDATFEGCDGYSVLQWIRTHERGGAMWVALMIPGTQNVDLWNTRPYLADLYLRRPFNPSDVL